MDDIRLSEAFTIVVMSMEEDGVLAFGYNKEQDLVSVFEESYDAAGRTN